MAKKEKTLEEKLKFKQNQLIKYQKELKHYNDLNDQDPKNSWLGYIAVAEAKVMKCKSEILLIKGQIWERDQNQPQ